MWKKKKISCASNIILYGHVSNVRGWHLPRGETVKHLRRKKLVVKKKKKYRQSVCRRRRDVMR